MRIKPLLNRLETEQKSTSEKKKNPNSIYSLPLDLPYRLAKPALIIMEIRPWIS